MFKSINQKLLLKRPQLWNLRIVPMLSIAIILHLIYFYFGYKSIYSIEYFHENYNSIYSLNHQDREAMQAFTGFALFLIILTWLFFYLRNNPFKSFYPVTRWYLVREFLLVFLILFSLTSIYHSFYYGRHLQKKKLMANINLVKDANTAAIAKPFLPIRFDDYEILNSCEEQEKKIARDHENALSDPCDTRSYESNKLMHSPKLSYFYYCKNPFLGSSLSSVEINQTIKRWITQNQQDSIHRVLNDLFNLANRLKIEYQVNDTIWVRNCLEDSVNHAPSYFMNNSGDYSEVQPYSPKDSLILSQILTIEDYFNFDKLEECFNHFVETNSENFLNVTPIQVYFYVALSLSVLLLLFRFLRFKPWIIGIIGSGILFILGAILSFNLDYILNAAILYAIFTISCFFLSLYFVLKGRSKLIAGVLLVIFACYAAALIPILVGILYDMTREISECINNRQIILRPEHPIHDWIQNNWDIINTASIGFIVLYMIAYIIPMAYRWQAKASE